MMRKVTAVVQDQNLDVQGQNKQDHNTDYNLLISEGKAISRYYIISVLDELI